MWKKKSGSGSKCQKCGFSNERQPGLAGGHRYVGTCDNRAYNVRRERSGERATRIHTLVRSTKLTNGRIEDTRKSVSSPRAVCQGLERLAQAWGALGVCEQDSVLGAYAWGGSKRKGLLVPQHSSYRAQRYRSYNIF